MNYETILHKLLQQVLDIDTSGGDYADLQHNVEYVRGYSAAIQELLPKEAE